MIQHVPKCFKQVQNSQKKQNGKYLFHNGPNWSKMAKSGQADIICCNMVQFWYKK